MPTSGIFKGHQFYVSDNEPEKKKLVKLIKSNGGSMALSHNDEDTIWIGRHDFTVGSDELVDPQYIYECDSKKQLVPRTKYLRFLNNNRGEAESNSKPAVQGRKPFTTKDKRILREWVTRVENFRFRAGDFIYEVLSEKQPQHTAESWKNHWKRYMENNLSKEEKKKFMTGAASSQRESDAYADTYSDQEPNSQTHGSRSSTAELLEAARALHALHALDPKRPKQSEVRKIQGKPNKLDAISEATTERSREDTPLFTSGHQQKESEKSNIVQSKTRDGEELLEKPDRRNILRIKIKRRPQVEPSATNNSAPNTHSRQQNGGDDLLQEDVIDLVADSPQHVDAVLETKNKDNNENSEEDNTENDNGRTEIQEEQNREESVISTVDQDSTRQPHPSSSSADIDSDKDFHTHAISSQTNPVLQPIPSNTAYDIDLNRKQVDSDNEWPHKHEQQKRRASSVFGCILQADTGENDIDRSKRHKYHRQESIHDQSPPGYRTEEPTIPFTRASSEATSQTGHIIDAFAAEEARNISMAMKQHTYKRITEIMDQSHRRWLGDLRGLMMDSDKDAMQVLTTLRISTGDWDVARAFLMRMKNKHHPNRHSSSWSGYSRVEVLQRDREELTRLMWSQKDDNTLLKGTPSQIEELIERKGRNNTNARRLFLQNL
ncbi:hypothetical protein BGW37DRAFT_150567 [Umbelopsis sp. PMI_123]|nr:hypothetical protein BGW37DRAFT_150567 [Umbelopsis sp. PMI_123]